MDWAEIAAQRPRDAWERLRVDIVNAYAFYFEYIFRGGLWTGRGMARFAHQQSQGMVPFPHRGKGLGKGSCRACVQARQQQRQSDAAASTSPRDRAGYAAAILRFLDAAEGHQPQQPVCTHEVSAVSDELCDKDSSDDQPSVVHLMTQSSTIDEDAEIIRDYLWTRDYGCAQEVSGAVLRQLTFKLGHGRDVDTCCDLIFGFFECAFHGQPFESFLYGSPPQRMPAASAGHAPTATFVIGSKWDLSVVSPTSFQVEESTVSNQQVPYNYKFLVLNYGILGSPLLHAGVLVNGSFSVSSSSHSFGCILVERWLDGIRMKICDSESDAVAEFKRKFSVRRFSVTRPFSSSATAGKLVDAALLDLVRRFPRAGEFDELIKQEESCGRISREEAKKRVVWKQTIDPQAQLTNCTFFATRAGHELGGGEEFFADAGRAIQAVHY